MIVKKGSYAEKELLNPESKVWDNAEFVDIKLYPTPVGVIQSDYIKINYPPGGEKGYGKIQQIRMGGLHDGSKIFFKFRWGVTRKNDALTDKGFPDGVAVIFPLKGSAPVSTMGSEKYPVNGWLWRADFKDKPGNIIAMGVGTVETVETKESLLISKSKWDGSHWNVVFGRAFKVGEKIARDNVKLTPGGEAKVAIACWEGGHMERAGCKSYSMGWIDLRIN